MARAKDEAWATVGVVAAGDLSATFGGSTQTDTWLRCDGIEAVKFALLSVVLGTATKVYVTPAFRDSAGKVTWPYQQNAAPVKWPLTATDQETPPFPVAGAYEVSAELWCDQAAGVTGAATVQAKRLKAD